MKRKLTKRNKQFLSSRYGKYNNGRYSFQKLYIHEWCGDGEITVKTVFDWTFSTNFINKVFIESFIADLEED